METRELICVNCPMGCRIRVSLENGSVLEIRGNSCPKGEAYARSECLDPMRILTTTVRIHHGFWRVLPVITEQEIPLRLMEAAMEEIRSLEVSAPVCAGQCLAENLAGTGVRLLASRSMKKTESD